MRDHEHLQNEIPAYVGRCLDASARRSFEAHLATCHECQDLVACGEALASEVRDADPRDEHPSSAVLERFARGSLSSDMERIAGHVESCLSCAYEVTVGRETPFETAARSTATGPAQAASSWFELRPLSMGALLGAGLAAIAVLFWWPGGSPPVTPWSGSPEILLLEGPSRGVAGVENIRVQPDQPVIPLGIMFRLDPRAADEDRFVFSIRRADGSESWRQEFPAIEIRQRLKEGFVLFLIPTAEHPPGRYDLTLRAAEPASEELLEIPFEIGAAS